MSEDLDNRLRAMEARIPVEAGPPEVATSGRRRRFAFAALSAPALVLALAATTLAGAVAVHMITVSSAPVSSPVADAGLECMTPPEAASWLAAHGYNNVVWDTSAGHGSIVIGGEILPAGASPAAGVTAPQDHGPSVPPMGTRSSTPPDHGAVFPGPVIDGQLIMFVDVTDGAPLPPTCAK